MIEQIICVVKSGLEAVGTSVSEVSKSIGTSVSEVSEEISGSVSEVLEDTAVNVSETSEDIVRGCFEYEVAENYEQNIEGSVGWRDVKNISDGNDITVEFNERVKSQVSSEGVQEIRENYENVDNVLNNIKDGIENSKTDIDLQRQVKRVEIYKGTVFEDMCKEGLKDKFESIDSKQITIETPEGNTKPDIVCREAREDFKIGNVEVKQGENLYAEVKCGSADYIESEMPHIEKQVLGHSDGKSIVIVSNDYLQIDPQKRALFESKLREKGSDIIVVDVKASSVEEAIYNNLSQY